MHYCWYDRTRCVPRHQITHTFPPPPRGAPPLSIRRVGPASRTVPSPCPLFASRPGSFSPPRAAPSLRDSLPRLSFRLVALSSCSFPRFRRSSFFFFHSHLTFRHAHVSKSIAIQSEERKNPKWHRRRRGALRRKRKRKGVQHEDFPRGHPS